jgi:hypothetical protein
MQVVSAARLGFRVESGGKVIFHKFAINKIKYSRIAKIAKIRLFLQTR